MIGAGLKLKPSKCQFLQKKVSYLGPIVCSDGVRPNRSKLACIRDFPVPTGMRKEREFLGLIRYYRKHVENFAKVAKPLTALTANHIGFE